MPSSSLFLSVGTILSALSSTAVATQYSQSESYTGKNWLDAFKFETYDLNNGFVNYVTEGVAKSSHLYRVEGDDVVFGVDGTETLDYKKGPGRKSVRLEGTKNYNHGLFVLDVKAMPGVCGMWPAFWSLGKEPWPVKGEIDIIEGVNDNKVNKYVLHTDTNCKVSGLGQTGTQAGTDCALNGPNGAAGCDVNEGRTNSFGPGFNANQGGHYVMEWDSDAIKTWFFPRGTAPSNIGSADVDTSTFGTPAANFKGDCNIDERFKDQRFIFTNNFCGDWAGNAYAASGCPMGKDASGNALSPMDSCKKYVAENPTVFANQFWKISSFKTYSKKSVSSSASSSMSRTSSQLSSSTHVSSSAHVTSSASHASSSSVHVSSSASSSVHVSVSSHVSSAVQSSSSVHVSVSSQVSSDVHSSSSVPHVVSTPSASLSSDVHSSTPIGHVSSSSEAHSSSVYYPPSQSSSSVYYPPGQSSSAAYPSSSAPVYPGISSSSSSVSVHYYGNFSAPVSYSVPVYNGDAYSTPIPPKSTPCTTSSAKGASSTPGYPVYPVYPSSVPAYGDYPSYPVSSAVKNDYPSYPASSPVKNDYPSYPVSSPVKNDYPYLPEFTPLTPVYPPTTSKPVYNDYNQPPSSKTTVTTTYTTTYVDVCETGYITKTTTFAVTYCPTTTPAVPTPGKPNNPPTYGWDVTTKAPRPSPSPFHARSAILANRLPPRLFPTSLLATATTARTRRSLLLPRSTPPRSSP
ncbi:hypothetical protein FB567DRAFT_191075 [Paraphoma chrysanthemicola]|uniref:GH16 domain-containing protein n=1 Tax=Paraphoma chrysanthemicola TaxID=798071 RepID=A0A8K0QV24_9PLEO|nr:hypothetical protein FB567DRAFT_191075 [Paraphoma chrysanthemicola]